MTTSREQHISPPPPVAEDDGLVTFERRWYLYGGGPPAAIMSEFGLGPEEFFTRILRCLQNPKSSLDHPHIIDAMKAVARKRLWMLHP